MDHTEEMLAFYRRLGLQVVENVNACSVYIGDQMINFHRPAHWHDKNFHVASSRCKTAVRGPVFLCGTARPNRLMPCWVALEQSSLKAQSNARAAAGELAPAFTCEIQTATSWNS